MERSLVGQNYIGGCEAVASDERWEVRSIAKTFVVVNYHGKLFPWDVCGTGPQVRVTGIQVSK